MSTIKLTRSNINKALAHCVDAQNEAFTLSRAESLAPVNVHSHGQLIKDLIHDLELALKHVREFHSQVQGR